jgi:RNA polymerase sigma factor (sigma-70 family)
VSNEDVNLPFDAVGEENWIALRQLALRFARLWCSEVEHAEDVAHEALLALFRRRHLVRDERAWLFIAIRGIALRSKARYQKRLSVCNTAADSFVVKATPGIDESDVMLKMLLDDRSLDGRDRRVVLLLMLGYSQREVALRLGQSQSAISRTLKAVAERFSVGTPVPSARYRAPHH